MQEDKTERTPSQETKEDSQTAVQVKLKDIFRDFRGTKGTFGWTEGDEGSPKGQI